MVKITTHTIVKNEENWIWYALKSWEKYATEMLVVDDNSTDETLKIIKSLKNFKIKIVETDLKTSKDHTAMRNKMVEETKTEWFLLLDGDEVWNQTTIEKFLDFLKKQNENIWAVAMRTRNCVGDVYHYLPEGAGNYQILGRKGHLTIRAYRKMPGLSWAGDYPLEHYGDLSGHVAFFEGFYWHMTHLARSSAKEKVKGWRSIKIEAGIPIANIKELPEVFQDHLPPKRSIIFEILARIITPIKVFKRKLIDPETSSG